MEGARVATAVHHRPCQLDGLAYEAREDLVVPNLLEVGSALSRDIHDDFVGVAVAVRVDVAVAVAVAVDVEVAVDVAVAVGEAVAVGVGVAPPDGDTRT